VTDSPFSITATCWWPAVKLPLGEDGMLKTEGGFCSTWLLALAIKGFPGTVPLGMLLSESLGVGCQDGCLGGTQDGNGEEPLGVAVPTCSV